MPTTCPTPSGLQEAFQTILINLSEKSIFHIEMPDEIKRAYRHFEHLPCAKIIQKEWETYAQSESLEKKLVEVRDNKGAHAGFCTLMIIAWAVAASAIEKELEPGLAKWEKLIIAKSEIYVPLLTALRGAIGRKEAQSLNTWFKEWKDGRRRSGPRALVKNISANVGKMLIEKVYKNLSENDGREGCGRDLLNLPKDRGTPCRPENHERELQKLGTESKRRMRVLKEWMEKEGC